MLTAGGIVWYAVSRCISFFSHEDEKTNLEAQQGGSHELTRAKH